MTSEKPGLYTQNMGTHGLPFRALPRDMIGLGQRASFMLKVRRDIEAGLYRDPDGRRLVLADPRDVEERLKRRAAEKEES